MTPAIKVALSKLALFQKDNPKYNDKTALVISISLQQIFRVNNHQVIKSQPISTALNGIGSEESSGKTPLGIHRIAEKIGDGAKFGTLFKARVNTKNTVPVMQAKELSALDAITTRILWLDGLEPGINKGTRINTQQKLMSVDSYQRYIYIHGTDEEWRLGQPVSHGCIRMANHAIVSLYDKVSVNTLVVIIE